MEGTATLQGYLERYLKAEGLYEVIAEHRRRSVFTVPIALAWFVGIWALAAYFILSNAGFDRWTAVVLGPPLMLLAALVVLSIAFAIRQFRLGKKLTQADTGTIGGFMLLGFPMLMAGALGVYLASWPITVLFLLLYGVWMSLVLVLQWQAYRAHLLIELFRSVLMALWRSVRLLVVLIPVLLVLVVLSVFSEELWQALGGLSAARLLATALWLVLPAFFLVVASLEREAKAIVAGFPEKEQIVRSVEGTSFIKDGLDGGLISEEEWKRITDELGWRDTTKLAEWLLPVLHNRVKRWLVLLLGLTSLTLVASLSLYFYVLFTVLLEPTLIASWTGIALDTLIIPLNLLGYSLHVALPTTVMAAAKVSLILATFATTAFIVHALTDETIKGVLTAWLSQKAASWLSASCLYSCAVSPNYQVWEYVVRDRAKGIANVFIVVPRGVSDDAVKGACEHMESRLEGYSNLVMITAFEQNPERPIYRLGMPGNRWRLLHNKVNGIRLFESIPLILDELRYQHFLGRSSVTGEGVQIPDDWFGNTPAAMALAKAIWEADVDHEWILHPYSFESDMTVSLEICLAKRKERSDEYRQCVRDLLVLARQMIPDAQNIWIELYFRDTLDTLARFVWSEQLSYVEYGDETDTNNKIEDRDDWE